MEQEAISQDDNRAMSQLSRHRWKCLGLAVAITVMFYATQPPVKCVAAAQAQSAPVGTPGQVTGHVYSAENGATIPKAVVTLMPASASNGPGNKINPASVRSTRADTEGAYVFDNVTPGNYTATASHAGFSDQSFHRGSDSQAEDMFTVNPGQTQSGIDIRLGAAGVISGTVLDEDFQPLEGVAVTAIRLRYAAGGRRQDLQIRIVMTDDLGNFRLYGLPPGDFYVRVQSPERGQTGGVPAAHLVYYPAAAGIEDAQTVKVVGGGESDIRISVPALQAYTISGNVVDATGADASKRYVINLTHTDVGLVRSETAEPDGSFTMRGVPSGDYILTAMAMQTVRIATSGPTPLTQGVRQTRPAVGTVSVRVADGDARVVIPIGQTGEVDGKLLVENWAGDSVSGIRISLQNQTARGIGASNYNDSTSDSGSFTFQDVQPGNYAFALNGRSKFYLKQALCSGRDVTLQPLVVDFGAAVGDCVLTVGKDIGGINGQVIDGTKLATNAVVVAIPRERSLRALARYTVTGNTDQNGNFQLSGVIPGDYLLFAVPRDDEQKYFEIDFADRNQQIAQTVSIKPNETKTMTLKVGLPQ